MSDQRNLIIAIVLSVAILVGFQYFYEMPRVEQASRQQQSQQQSQPQQSTQPAAPGATPGRPAAPTAGGPAAGQPAPREQVLSGSPRVRINTPSLHGSLSLRGGRIDDLTLADYHVSVQPGSPEITLLSPVQAPQPYYADFGWTAAPGSQVALPGPDTLWQADGNLLAPDSPVTLSWDNGQGLRFLATFKVDRDYMFTVTQRVENRSGDPVTLYPFGLISRHGMPDTAGFFILHEGPVGVLDDKLTEIKYDDLAEEKRISQPSTGGWLGFTDKYWLTALVPSQQLAATASFNHATVGNLDHFQVDYLGEAVTVPAGGDAETGTNFFAGAKEVQLLDRYEAQYGINRFDLAIDWGWFYFLTKPIFFALDYLFRLLGNFGLAIIALTVIIKILFLPLAHRSYVAMSAMKKLQPEMMKLRERFGDDRTKLNQEMMALYKRAKVNPASGCLPIILQIPVFFALYKVLFVTIEMRHAPFYGWIHDLSAPDPTTIFNLFGLIPWAPPTFLMIGLWPLLMGLSMFLQQRLNPQPADPVQAKVFLLMPVFFTFLLASFPAGLVIYWTWNNILSIAQQWLIMKRMGVPAG